MVVQFVNFVGRGLWRFQEHQETWWGFWCCRRSRRPSRSSGKKPAGLLGTWLGFALPDGAKCGFGEGFVLLPVRWLVVRIRGRVE